MGLELDDGTDVSPPQTPLWFLSSGFEKVVVIGCATNSDVSGGHEDNIGFAKGARSFVILLHLFAIDLENKSVGWFAETAEIQVLKKEERGIGSTYEVRV